MPRLRFTSDETVKRLRWIVLFVMLLDDFVTLLGQRWTFWQDSKNISEIDPVWRFFLAKGVIPYIGADLFYIIIVLLIASVVPRAIGIAFLFWLLLAHFWGVTAWLVYRFGCGLLLQQAFELGIAVLITFALYKSSREHPNSPNKSPEPTAVGAVSSAVAVPAASRRWLSFFR